VTVESTKAVAGTDNVLSLRERGLKAFGFIYIFASGIALGVNSEIGEKLVEATIIAWLPLLLIRPARKSDRAETLWIMMAALTAISAWLSFYLHSDLERAKGMTEVYSKYLLPVFYLFILRRINFTLTHLRVFFISIALCACITATYESLYYQSRGFMTHGRPILFGGIALISGWLSVLLLNTASKWPARMLTILAFTAGVFTALYSQSRGVWIALPALLILPALLPSRQLRPFRTYGIALGATMIAVTLALYQFTDIFERRIELALSDIQSYQSDSPLSVKNSVGARLEMWKAAVMLFKEYPIWGVGIGDLPQHLEALAREGLIAEALVTNHFTHMHNEYFHVLATRGIVGITTLLAMMIWLFFFFKSHLAKSTNYEGASPPVERLCQAGIALLVACAIYSLTDSYFSSNVGSGFFLLSMTLIVKIRVDLQAETKLRQPAD